MRAEKTPRRIPAVWADIAPKYNAPGPGVKDKTRVPSGPDPALPAAEVGLQYLLGGNGAAAREPGRGT